MNKFLDRIYRAAKLDANLYEEVEADKTAMRDAISVVILSGLAAGIGTVGTMGMQGILVGTVAALAGWFIWAYLTYFIGTRLLPEPQTRSDPSEMLRTIGFASSPGLIRILAVIPGAASIILFAAAIWSLAAMVIAVRQALDYRSTMRAIGVCAIGWVIQIVIIGVIFYISGGAASS
ncbi:MAG: YIP1 family protein [Syntrophales bacterium]|jgi:hypothetical protein|nr:YIP1 family protein [Syntrophales bacterium]MDY0044391.1 YIP1 family protein [Syntrophales bacterium]